MSVTEQNSLLF